MLRVYLAGPMSEGEWWREYATDRLGRLGIQTEVPEFLRTYREQFGVEDDEASRILTQRDKHFATTCAVVLANFAPALLDNEKSIGTSIELGWASQAGTTIVSVIPEGNPHDHPIIRSVSTYVVPNLECAIGIIAALAWDNSAGAWRSA